MSKYRLDSGKVVDTAKAAESWEEDTYWNGNNYISRATGSQWHHETLYRSSKGTYYIVHSSQWQGESGYATEVAAEEAAEWLVLNDQELPEDLKHIEVSE